jgi:hypothetical protein
MDNAAGPWTLRPTRRPIRRVHRATPTFRQVPTPRGPALDCSRPHRLHVSTFSRLTPKVSASSGGQIKAFADKSVSPDSSGSSGINYCL